MKENTIEQLEADGVETLRSDGNAVEVLTDEEVDKGEVILKENFFGIVMQHAESGEYVAIEIQQREHELVVPNEVDPDKGDILYLDTDGVITASGGTNIPFLKVTKAKDDTDVVWGILLPQYTNVVAAS
jgi:predicted RecA/RadA family phage recombinase